MAPLRLPAQQTSGKSKDRSGDEDEDGSDEAAAFELPSKHQPKRSRMPITSATLKKAKMDHVPLSDDEAKDELIEDDHDELTENDYDKLNDDEIMSAEEADSDFAIPNSKLFDNNAATAAVLEDIGSVFPQLHPSHPQVKAFLMRIKSISD